MSCRTAVVLEYLVHSFDSRPGRRVDRPQRVALQEFVHMDGQKAGWVCGHGKFTADSTVDLLEYVFDVNLKMVRSRVFASNLSIRNSAVAPHLP